MTIQYPQSKSLSAIPTGKVLLCLDFIFIDEADLNQEVRFRLDDGKIIANILMGPVLWEVF